jgi:hypothetical protein
MGKGTRVKYLERPVRLTGDIPLAQIIHKSAASAADGPDRQFQRLVDMAYVRGEKEAGQKRRGDVARARLIADS